MSNKFALATIQFRADAKGANVALETLQSKAADARRTVNDLEDAMKRGIKTMRDANGVEFDVAAKFHSAEKQARSFEKAVRELIKGATALETVVGNIRLGEIEKSSRAELKGAINAAEARKRSVRETDPEDLKQQRELNKVIEESRKQLNRLDRDTAKVIETLQKGGTVAESVLDKEMKGLKEILTMIPKGTQEWKEYNAQLKQIENFKMAAQTKELEKSSKLLSSSNLGKYSEEQIRSAIASAKELLTTYKTASPEAQKLAQSIVAAENHLKNYGVEAARVAAKEAQQIKTQEEAEKQLQATMNKRLRSLSTLSTEALAETKRYWQAQVDGAEKGTAAFNKAADALKKIDAQERTRKFNNLNTILGDPSKFGISEIRQAVQEMERLRDSVAQGTPLWNKYNTALKQGKEYLDQLARTEAADKVAKQMHSLNTLSATGLQEVKKYWESMVAGAKLGSTELNNYKLKLEQVTAEEQRRTKLQARQSVSILGGNLNNYSEAQIRQAIEAGNQLIKTYKTGSTQAVRLGRDIVAAETHLKQYGVEAARSAQREKDMIKKANDERAKANQEMIFQLTRTRDLTPEILKQQEQYWQRLINDPKTATTSLATYKNMLDQVHRLQEAMVQSKGQAALNFFRGDTSNASANQLKEQAEALRKYRDTLPRQANAAVIQEIDGYLAKMGMTAQKTAEQTMKLADAEALAAKIGTQGFSATTTQLQQAKKALVEEQQAVERGSKRFTELQAAINKVDLELAKMGELSAEVKATLDSPKGKSFNELKQAVEQGRKALAGMRTETEKDKREFDDLAKKVKEADFQMKQLGNSSKGTATAFEKAWSRLKTYITLYVGAAMAMQKIATAMGDILELSDKLGEVRKTTGFTADEVGRLSDSLRKIDTRTTITGLLDLSVAAGQLGLKTQEDVEGFTIAANKLMVALPEMGKEGATQMLKVALATGEIDKIRKQMEQGIIDGSSATAVAMEKVGSTIDRLRATSAATAPAITDFVKRVGAVGAQSGISIDQVAALGAAVDALGMRVEMSATALSRMIPAIRNNAFDVAKAIGVTPETLRDLFETGRGMEAILMIFQHIKDAGMDENSVENMLGMGNMKEIMKELNQQGARAGIVFSGLSQNVDVLRSQLKTASEAYKENTAIQQEYEKMNETTAAKWERLKNRIEKFFVGDESQRWFGSIIDKLRVVVDFITDDGPIAKGLRYIAVYIGLLKSKWAEAIGTGVLNTIHFLRNIRENFILAGNAAGGFITKLTATITSVNGLKNAWKGLDAAMKSNIITAVGMALYYLYSVLKDWNQAAKEAAAETMRFNDKLADEKKALDALFNPLKKDNAAQDERSRLISEINSKYSKYLGYMLSETNTAIELANAHQLIAKRIREEAYEKRILDQEDKVREKHNEDISTAYGAVEESVRGGAKSGTDVAAVTDMLKSYIDQNLERSSTTEGYKAFRTDLNNMLERLVVDGKLTRGAISSVTPRLLDYMKEAKDQAKDIAKATANTRSDLRNVQRGISAEVNNNLNSLIGNLKNFGQQTKGGQGAGILARPGKQEGVKLPGFELQQFNPGGVGAQVSAEIPLPSWKPTINKQNIEEVRSFVKAQEDLRGYLKANADRISEQARATASAYLVSEQEMKELRDLLPKEVGGTGGTGGTGGGGGNVWGSRLPAESTDYKDMKAEVLVNRRKQMNEFVNAIQTDTDVNAVLAEDAALKKAIEAGMSSDMRTVIEWYNTERLKIQDELHARHLTNTGDWLDPKKSRARKKRLQDDMRAFLEELDAYYTERKTRIQEAGNEEGITEAEVRNRTLANEMEWRQRRAELQIMYSKKAKEVTEDEQNAIAEIIATRTGDDAKFIRATIQQTIKFSEAIKAMNDQGAKEYSKFQGDLDLGSERDYNKAEMALRQHLKAIEDIIDKERPFNGITKNLRENLVTMGILTADMSKERDKLISENADMLKFNERQAAEEVKRTAFMLGEAENAYSTTIEDVMRRMADKGMQAWADELRKSPEMQEGLMAQLRSTYDAVQEAIKKEASQIKKQAEIMWNNILLPDGQTTLKDATDRAIAQLSLDQNRVSRANGLIGAGASSERVADKLAIKQMQLQLTMQEHYYNLMKKKGMEQYRVLLAQAEAARLRGDNEEAIRKELDAQHALMALNLATAKEENDLAKQREEIIARTEESQNRLYTTLREWAGLLSSGVQSLMEATHAGDAEYYNELAKLNLTGKGGPGAGTYIIIDNEGTEDATAHYEYLNEREALERQREIEQQNAVADAWKKLMDDLNTKMNEQITDWMNTALQTQSIDANTQAVIANTMAIYASMGKGESADFSDVSKLGRNVSGQAVDKRGLPVAPVAPEEREQPAAEDMPQTPWQMTEEQRQQAEENMSQLWTAYKDFGITAHQDMSEALSELPTPVPDPLSITPEMAETAGQNAADAYNAVADAKIAASERETEVLVNNAQKQKQATLTANNLETKSTQSMFAKMTAAANLYGTAYQIMSNDNLSAAQKFQMFALQAAGQAAIGMLTTDLFKAQGDNMVQMPGILGKLLGQMPYPAAMATYAAVTALMGGLMGLAVSKVAKSKSQISQVTGASASAGRLSTGMLTYAEGNVNEFSDPASLTPGRSYNVDAADGKTYRAKYTGSNPGTHLTNGPEFHLAGEKGREMIIDAGTTRQITMNDNEIWQAIKTLSGGGRVQSRRSMRRGVKAFADGNVDEFDTVDSGAAAGELGFDPTAMQASLDKNNELLERALTNGIKGVFNVYGKDGLIDSYDTGKKNVTRHGERY